MGTISTYYTDANYRPFSILSKNYWSQAKSCCDCPYSGVPSGLYSGTGYYEVARYYMDRVR